MSQMVPTRLVEVSSPQYFFILLYISSQKYIYFHTYNFLLFEQIVFTCNRYQAEQWENMVSTSDLCIYQSKLKTRVRASLWILFGLLLPTVYIFLHTCSTNNCLAHNSCISLFTNSIFLFFYKSYGSLSPTAKLYTEV